MVAAPAMAQGAAAPAAWQGRDAALTMAHRRG